MRTTTKLLTIFTLSSAAWLGGCNTEAQTQELIQAKLDAEKVKDLSAVNQDLKTQNDALKKENDGLKIDVAKLTAAAQQRLAQARVAHQATADKPSPAEIDNLKKAVTGGGSFK